MKIAPKLVLGPGYREYWLGNESISRLDVLSSRLHVRPEWTAVVEEPQFRAEHPDFVQTLSLDDFSERILGPRIEKMAEKFVEGVLRGRSEGGLATLLGNSVKLSDLLGHDPGIPSVHVLTPRRLAR